MLNFLAAIGNSGVTAAAGSFESIATFTSSGSTNTITFSSIPNTYQHLQLRIYTRSARSAASDLVYIRLNSISSNSYSWHQLSGNGTDTSANGIANDNVMLVSRNPAASSTSNTFAGSIIDFHDYASTTKNKTARVFAGYDLNGSGLVELRSNALYNTGAIDNIFIAHYNAGDNFAAGSHFALYGIKGA